MATACSVGSGPHCSRHHRAQDTDSPAGLGGGWVEADDSQGFRYPHGTVHRTDRAGTSRARDKEQPRTTSTSSNGPPEGACTPAGRLRWGFHPCNNTANTTQVNQGGGPAATVQDGPGPQACLEDTLAVMGSVLQHKHKQAIDAGAAKQSTLPPHGTGARHTGYQCSPVVSHHSE